MQNYMIKLNSIKKYILPVLFLIMTFVAIPKGAYYKKGDIDITIATTEGTWKGNIYLKYPNGYKIDNPLRSISGEKVLKQNIKNTVIDKYIIYIKSKIGKISELKFTSNGKVIIIPQKEEQKHFNIPWKDIEKIYAISIVNVLLYFCVTLSLILFYFKKGIETNFKNIGTFSLALVFLAISLDLKWLSKANGILLSLTVLKTYLDRKKIRFGFLEVTGFILLILSLLSEYFNFFNYEKAYIYFQNTILIIIAMKIWSFNYEDKKNLKKIF